MKIELSRDALNVAIGKISGVISSYETVPVLKTYHLMARAKLLKLAATDMDLGVTVETDLLSVAEEGDIALPASKLNEIVRSLPAGCKISLLVENGIATIKSIGAMWKIKGIVGSDFPEMPSFQDSGQVWLLKRAELLVILERLHGLIAVEGDLRVALKAISVASGRIMATDGEALGVQRHNFQPGSVQQIPGACVKDLMSVLRLSGVEEVQVFQGEEFLFIEVGDDTFFTRLLDDWTFPDVAVLLEAFTLEVLKTANVVDRKRLYSAVQRVKVTASSESQEITVSFGSKDVTLMASSMGGDSAQEGFPCIVKDLGVSCSVNWIKLALALNVMQSEKLHIKIMPDSVMVLDKAVHLYFILMRRDL